MLDFYFIPDAHPTTVSPSQLAYAGGIEEEEFEMAQKTSLVESHADFYGKFRWSSEQVKRKLALLANCSFRSHTVLNEVLSQAKAAEVGLVAFGD